MDVTVFYHGILSTLEISPDFIIEDIHKIRERNYEVKAYDNRGKTGIYEDNLMSWINNEYKNSIRKYDKKDGLKAIIIYCLIMGSAFFQGWLYTTNTSALLLNASQIWIPLILVLLFFCFLYYNKEQISSVGINAANIRNSMILGIVGGFLLLAIQTALFMAQGKTVSFNSPLLMNWIIFLFAALEEEILFRGYIQTRLSGLINRQLVVGIINSVLFVFTHYPVRWVVSGSVSFNVLPAIYVISLLALHFFCDAVYKRTNCLWGSVLLHLIYNAVGAMIVI